MTAASSCGSCVPAPRATPSPTRRWINGSWDASLPTRAAWPKERFKDSQYDDDSVIVQDDLDSGADAESADDVSGTNVQEQGVDEPDLVKADRRYLYVMAGSRLRIYRHRPSVPVLVAQLRLPIAEGGCCALAIACS